MLFNINVKQSVIYVIRCNITVKVKIHFFISLVLLDLASNLPVISYFIQIDAPH